MVFPCLSWRMNYYEIMFLLFKGYHIHRRVNLHNLGDFNMVMLRLLGK